MRPVPENTSSTLTLHRRKDGKIINMSLTISPIVDSEGNVTSASTVGSDISHRVSLEQQLRQAQKMEALGTLAGGIAHDFNNILTAIIGHASLLNLKLDQNDPLTENVHQILEAASRAANLTEALLGFSRKAPIETKPVSLNAIVKKVERLLVMLLKENVSYQATLSQNGIPSSWRIPGRSSRSSSTWPPMRGTPSPLPASSGSAPGWSIWTSSSSRPTVTAAPAGTRA